MHTSLLTQTFNKLGCSDQSLYGLLRKELETILGNDYASSWTKKLYNDMIDAEIQVIFRTDWPDIFPDDPVRDLQFYVDLHHYYRRMYRRSKDTDFKIKNEFVNMLLRSSSFNAFEQRYELSRICRLNPIFSQKIFNLLENKMKLFLELVNKNVNKPKRKIDVKNKYYVLDIEPCMDDDHTEELDYLDLASSLPTVVEKKRRRLYITHSQLYESDYVRDREWELVRDPKLLTRLHSLIKIFEEARSKCGRMLATLNQKYLAYRHSLMDIEMQDMHLSDCEEASAQMDTPHGDKDLDKDKAGNVVLTAAEGSSSVTTAPKQSDWVPYTSSDVKGEYSQMTDRWIKFNNFTWEKKAVANQLLVALELPKDVVFNAIFKTCDMPNLLPFRVHRYCKVDMEIKIQINSNKFQLGQLQCSWYYQPYMDNKFDLRKNIYSASQAHHVLISAGASNEAILRIPFKYHLPMMPTQKRRDNLTRLNIGSLFIRVLNPLSTATTGPSACYGTIFCRFLNCTFTGQISGKLFDASPQMDRLLTGALNGALEAMVPNADNVQDTRNPQYVVPIAAHSWSYGTGITEPLQALRLDPRGVTHHPSISSSESMVSHVVGKYGLIKTIIWGKNDGAGTKLLACNAAPILELAHYYSVASSDKHILDTYVIPPVGVVSSMFSQWRGPLRFRFDIIASQFHTGRLIIGYVPGATVVDNVNINTILAGPHMVFSLQDDQQFVFEVPFIADRPFWSRQYMGNFVEDAVLAPSRVYMFVLNPLIPMESVYDKVYINMYMSAGSGFEVAIPVQPSLGLAFNKAVAYSGGQLIKSTGGAYYAGVWHSFESSKYLCMRAGTTSDQIQYFDNRFLRDSSFNGVNGTFRVYSYSIMECASAPRAMINGQLTPLCYAVLIWADSSKTNAIMVPTLTPIAARNAALQYIRGISAVNNYIVAGSTTSNTWSNGNPLWIASIYEGVIPGPRVDPIDPVVNEGFEIIASPQGERESASNVIQTGSLLRSTNFGMSLYGERFSDLKDLLRRYQFYCDFHVDTKSQNQNSQVVCNIPMLYQGLDLNIGSSSNINEFSNRCREGHIPLILSGYRYARGSMRIRFVFPTASDIIATVQHRPDRTLRHRSVMSRLVADDANSLINHSYASYVQDCGVNSILQLEVPFYKNSTYNFLQECVISGTDEAFYCTLGDLTLSLNYPKPDYQNLQNYTIACHYSMADDFHPSTFQGFPPVVVLDNIETAEPEMGEIEDEIASAQMFSKMYDKAKSKFGGSIKEDASKFVKEEVIEPVQEEIKKLNEVLNTTTFGDLMNTSIMRTIISQIAHCYNNFSLKTVTIAIVTILIEMSVCTLDIAQTVMGYISSLLSRLERKVSGTQPNQPDVARPSTSAEVATPEMEDVITREASTGLITILWASMCSIFSLANKKPKKLDEWRAMIVKDIPDCLKSANVVFVFIRNILLVWDSMKYKIVGYVSPVYRAARNLDESQAELKAWAQEVLHLDDPLKFNREKYNQEYKARVHIAYTQGKMFVMNAVDTQDHKISRLINDIYKKIYNLREKMLEFGDDGYVRKEPFIIWQYGEPGLGKSTLTHDLAIKLLQSRREIINGPPIYNHSVASQYWDTCRNNPVMVIDDLFNVQEGEMLQQQLALLFMLVSPVVLSPPKARLEDKGTFYNPLIGIINSNYEFLNFSNVNKDAIHRRRHVLVKYVKGTKKIIGCPHCDGKPLSEVPKRWLEDYHHINFQIHNNPIDPEAGYGPVLDWTRFSERMCEKYNTVMHKNEEMHRERMQSILALMNGGVEVMANDPEVSISEATKRILEEQQNQYKRIFQDSVLGSCKSLFYNTTGKAKEMYTKFALYMCRLSPHKKGLLDNIQLEPQTKVKAPEGEISLQDYLSACFDKSEAAATSQGDSPSELLPAMANFNLFMHEMYAKARYNETRQYFERQELAYKVLAICNGSNTHISDLTTMFTMCDDMITIGNFFDKLDFHYKLCTTNAPYPLKGARVSYFRRMLDIGDYLARNDLLYNILEDVGVKLGDNFKGERNKDNRKICIHWDYEVLNKMTYDSKNEKFYYRDMDIGKVCMVPGSDTELYPSCPWQSCMYQYFFYKAFIFANPIYATYMELPSYVLRLPYALRDPKYMAKYEIDKHFSRLQKIKDGAIVAALNVSKVAGFIWKVLKNLLKLLKVFIPLIMPSMFLATAYAGHVMTQRVLQLEDEKAANWGSYEPQASKYDTVINRTLNDKVPVARSESDIPQFAVVIERLRQNMLCITAVFDNKTLKGFGPVLKGRQVLLLRHYLEEFDALPPYTKYYAKFPHRMKYCEGVHGVCIDFPKLNRIQYNHTTSDGTYKSNFVIVDLPLQIPECKDLTRFIATTKDHQLCNGDGVLYENNNFIHSNLFINREKGKPITIQSTDVTSRIILQDLYSYRIQGKGKCGSVLLARNLERPIVGIHVAGIERGNIRGLAEPLVYETFNKVPEPEDKGYSDIIIPTLDSVEYSKIDVDALIYPVGCVDSNYTAHNMGRSCIIPSLIHGVFPVRTEPGPLTMSDPRLPPGSRPLEDGIAHKGKPVLDFDPQGLKLAKEDLSTIFKMHVKPLLSVGVKDIETVVCGKQGVEFYEKLEFSTSPGFPLRFLKDAASQTGKKWLFDIVETNEGLKLHGLHPKLMHQLTIEHNMRLRGVRPFTVFIDCLKDSTMPAEKCRISGKTRIFSISPVQFTIAFKQYFIDFMAAYQKARLNAEHGIGIDVNSLEWTDLATKLLNKGTKMVCGDYKNYGHGLMLSAAWQAFNIIFDWYEFHGDGQNNNIRRIMAIEVLNAYYLAENLIYTTPCGIPSGSPITTPLNSIVGSLYIRMAWSFTTNLSYSTMHEKICIFTYGDDIIMGVHDDIIDKFNTQTISDFFALHNIVFTDADKTGNIVMYRDIFDSSFLKCKFALHPKRSGTFIAQLDKVSIEGCANWISKKSNYLQATIENCEQTLELAHGHGKQYYNDVMSKLVRAMQNIGATFRISSWEEIDERRYGDLFIFLNK